MTRIGCLYIPDFRIQVHRHEAGLEPHRALALLTPKGRRLEVCAVSPGAQAGGIQLGMSAAQAEVASPETLLREELPARYDAWHASLLDALQVLTPLVEAERLGVYYIGMQGLRWLHRDEAALMEGCLAQALEQRLEATAGVASSRFTAWTAARIAPPGQLRQVRTGDALRFLDGLPLTLLPTTLELLERFRLVGLDSLGALARLSPRAVERRYGRDGAALYRLARAEDGAYLTPRAPQLPYTRSLLLEMPVEAAEGLIFLLGPLLEALLEQLRQEGRACAAMLLSLRLDLRHADPIEVPVALGAPVTQTRPLIELLRLKLARLSLEAGVVELSIQATQVTEPSVPQTDLFIRVGSPSGMAVTLARLGDALGADAVVTARLVDAWRPDQTFLLEPAQTRSGELLLLEERARRTKMPQKRSRSSAANPAPEPVQAPVSQERAEQPLAGGFRRMTPPQALTVVLEPISVREEGTGGATGMPTGMPIVALVMGTRRRQVVECRGPFRYQGLWWADDWARDYYQVLLKDRCELLIFQDHAQGGWFVDGFYD